jgi:membrane-associated protease RseP (regulator of RpoE activity)
MGVNHWTFSFLRPESLFGTDFGLSWRWTVLANFQQGIVYMAALIGILLAHELGHFVLTLVHRIPASLPYFIPLPGVSPIGTMGAVIGMAASKANRRQIFDVGIAGPIAGLVVLFPVLIIGIQQLDLTVPPRGGVAFDCPLIVRILIDWLRPEYRGVTAIWVNQTNAMFMAAWVGLLVTGLNMMPLSQLDGGHVTYALLRRKAHWVARLFLLSIMAYIVWQEAYSWVVMTVLVTFIGVDHPPTSNDRIPLGMMRQLLGWISLSIPILCFPPQGMILYV